MNNKTAWQIAPDAAAAKERDALCLVTVLIRARAILAEPDSWTRGALARSWMHRGVLPGSDYACSWSTSGAFALALFDVLGASAAQRDRERLYDLGISSLWHSLPLDHPRTLHMSLDIDGFNDYPGTEYAQIVQLFERALQGARSGVAVRS